PRQRPGAGAGARPLADVRARARDFSSQVLWFYFSGLQSLSRLDGPPAAGTGPALGRRRVGKGRPSARPGHAGNAGTGPPSQLSGGEKQRVAIGRALIKDPVFCFADEPTAALDWTHGEQVIELLRTAARERGTTVLAVAHDSRIVPYVDRVFHLDDGCLVEPEPAQGQELWSVP